MSQHPSSLPRLTLAEALEQRIIAKRTNWRKLAAAISVSYPTLRTWKSRNRFPEERAVELAQLLELPGSSTWTSETLAAAYDIGAGWADYRSATASPDDPTSSLVRAFRLLDASIRRVKPTIDRLTREAGNLFDAMQEGDLFVFCSATVTPMEFDQSQGDWLAEKVVAALSRRASCLYLRPNPRWVRYYYEELAFRRILQPEDMRREIHEFRENAQRFLAKTMNPEEAERRVWRYLDQYYCDDCPFWTPGFAIGMFQSPAPHGEIIRRMTVRLPGDSWGIIPMPEYELFAWRFGRFLHRALAAQATLFDEDEKTMASDALKEKDRQKTLTKKEKAEAIAPIHRQSMWRKELHKDIVAKMEGKFTVS